MSDHRTLLERYFSRVWGDGDPEAVREFASPDYRRHVSPTSEPLGLDAQVARLQGIRSAFPDVEIELVESATENDLISFRSVMRGTHQGTLMGIAATGRRIEVHLVDMIRVRDGRFVEQWGGPDMLDLLRQLGASVSP